MDSKESEEHSLVKNKHRTLNGGQMKIVIGGPRVNKARKVLRKEKTTSLKMIFAPTNQKKVQVMNSTCTKAETRTKKGNGEEGVYPQSGLSTSETHCEDGIR